MKIFRLVMLTPGNSKCSKPAENKGFSLLELVVALSVSLVALGIILSLAVILNNSVSRSKNVAESISEVYAVEDTVTEFFYRYDSTEYELSTKNNKLLFSSENRELVLWYEDGRLITEEDELTLERVTDVAFSYDEESGVLLITVSYKSEDDEMLEYQFVLLHHT